MDCFVYGTLRHLPHLEVVLGRDLSDVTLTDDALPGYAVYKVLPQLYPYAKPQKGALAPGLRIGGLTTADRARLTFYEGVFGYPRQTLTTQSGARVEVFVPGDQAAPASDALWDLDAWAAERADLICMAAQEIMSLMGRMAPEEVAQYHGRITARAQSRLNAAASRHGALTLSGKVDVEWRERSYFSFFAFDEMRFRHEQFNGETSEPVSRGVFLPTDAAIVLPYDPITDRVLLVEQVRTGPIARGDQALWQLEPVAGLIDPGETAQETARREAVEEAGLILKGLETVAEAYSSPGGSSDFLYLFVGLCDLPDADQRLGGLASEGEDIRSHILPFETLEQMARACQLGNLPLMTCVFWLSLHRARLRSG